MTTGNKAQRLKYLGVEILKKDATKSSVPEVGLFRGLRERSDGEGADVKTIRLILIGAKDKENDIKALNLAVFNILSIKMTYGDTKELIVFKSNEADQDKAMMCLETALEEFQKEKRMVDNDPEIIDVKTFDDVPAEFFAPQDTKTNKTDSSQYPYNGGGYAGCGFQNSDWQKKEAERKKEKERQDKLRWTPTSIKRKTELPKLPALNLMKKKIAAIAAGEYEEPTIDPDPTDTFEDGKKSSTVV